VHFLTVAAYNLQHPAQFTEPARLGLREQFIAYMDQGVSIAQIRRQIGHMAAGAERVLKPEAERQLVLRHWQMTIADVYIPDCPADAADRVKAWAASIRHELV
jgi:hypothetical protein